MLKNLKKLILVLVTIIFIQACTTSKDTSLTKVVENEETSYMTIDGKHGNKWMLTASKPLLIGGYGDNFVYNGEKVQALTGTATVDVNAATNTGKMVAEFYGTITPEAGKTFTGNIKLEYNKFLEGSDFWEGGIADFVYLHGATKQEAPVMPKVKTPLASWGPVNVYVDDKLIYEKLVGHMMYTEASRDKETYAIYNSDRSGFYSPKDPTNGSIAHPDQMELHFVAHTTDPDSGNFPPHTVWIHLNYIVVSE